MLLRSIYLKSLRDMRTALAWWAGGIFVLNIWMMSFFPSLSNMDGLDQFLDVMPSYMLDMFGDLTAMNTLNGFLTVELMSFFMPLMFIIFAVNFGGNIISKEEDDNSLDLLLSQPIPRWRVAAEKYAAIVTFTTIVAMAGWLGLEVGAAMLGIDISDSALLAGMFVHIPFALFFAGLTLAITGLKRGKSLATGVSAGLAFVTYLSLTFLDLANLPEWTQYVSPWYWFDGMNVLYDGVNWGLTLPLFVIAFALAALGMWGFSQRDIGA